MAIETVVIGARGYTGSALLPLLHRHSECRLTAVASGRAAGQSVSAHVSGLDGLYLSFTDIVPSNIADFSADLYILALPNGEAPAYVEVLDNVAPEAVVIDLSADYRFDDTWVYGQPELFRERLKGAKRISNPGCYATGAQLALAPIIDECTATPVVFGISGYSGAGRTPSRKNDLSVLRDNLMPYSLAEHTHEREATRHLGRPIRFLPHVVSWFSGISLSIAVELQAPVKPDELLRRFLRFYADAPLVDVIDAIPEVTMVRDTHRLVIGGFTPGKANPRSLSLVCVLDNLLKGAATQAVQNLNLAFGLPEMTGLDPGPVAVAGKTA